MQHLCSARLVFFQVTYMYPITIFRLTILFDESFVFNSVQSPFLHCEPIELTIGYVAAHFQYM